MATNDRAAYLVMIETRIEIARKLSVQAVQDLDDSFSDETRAKLEKANSLLFEVQLAARNKYQQECG